MPSAAQLRKKALQQMQKTKHVRRGRVWGWVMAEPDKDRYAINKVSLRVARGVSAGRWETFENSRSLLLRMDAIGKDWLHVFGLIVNGEHLPGTTVRSLSHYLWSCKGLTYFRRSVPFGYTRTVLCDLLSRIGIPTHNVIKHQIVHQVRDGQGRKGGARKDRGLSLPRGQRRKCARGNENLGSPGGEAKA